MRSWVVLPKRWVSRCELVDLVGQQPDGSGGQKSGPRVLHGERAKVEYAAEEFDLGGIRRQAQLAPAGPGGERHRSRGTRMELQCARVRVVVGTGQRYDQTPA